MAMAPPRKGENWELRQQLNSEYRDKRADAIKRVIANHTIGKDCSGLFPDVVKNMASRFNLAGSSCRPLIGGTWYSKRKIWSKRSWCTCI